MRPETEALVILQSRDTEIQRLELELKDVPKLRSQAKERLKDDNDAVAKAKANSQENAVVMKNKELDIDTRKNTIKRLHQQQFETKKNEEYTALGNEIIRYGQDVDSLETEQLELMEIADTLSQAQDSAASKLASTQKTVDEDLASLDKKEAVLKERLVELQAERAKFAENVNESDLSLYSRLLKSKNGTAMAEVSESGQCLGCHIKLVPATIVKLRGGKETVMCENCSRIIYEI